MPNVNPEILRWARETAGLTLEDAVQKLKISKARGVPALDRLAALEAGEEAPTRPMLVKMAKQYRRPLLTFYMSAPPRKADRGQDFRTLPEGYSTAEDALLDALIRDVRARQSMVRAVLEDEDEAEVLPFVGSVRMSDGVPAILESIRETLEVDIAEFWERATPEDAFALLRARAEAAGVFVLLIGNLGSHHTSIDLEVFRGFALADAVAPFVIVNDQDAKPSWSFTLVHELAHLWLGQTGVSGARAERAIERFCNEIAGEFLLPADELRHLHVDDTTDFQAAAVRIGEFASDHNLSRSMVAYRLHRAGVIEMDTWRHLSDAFREEWLQERADRRERARDRDGGPSYYVLRRHRVGSALIDLVRRMMAGGTLTTSKAGKVLGVKPGNVQMLIDTAGPSGAGRAA
jgi:Zn-dependent peptidase ImmA (M78 family)